MRSHCQGWVDAEYVVERGFGSSVILVRIHQPKLMKVCDGEAQKKPFHKSNFPIYFDHEGFS